MTHPTMPIPASFVLFPTSSSRSTGTCSSLSCGLEESTIGSLILASLNSRSSLRKARPDSLCPGGDEPSKQKEGRIFARRKQAIRRHTSMKSIEDATSSNPSSSDGTATKKQRPRRHQSTGTSTEDHVVEEVPLLVPIPMNFEASLKPEDMSRWETLAEKVDHAPKSHCQKGDHQHCNNKDSRRVRVQDCCHKKKTAAKKEETRRSSATLPVRSASGQQSSSVAKQKMWASCPALCHCQDSPIKETYKGNSSSRWGQGDAVPALNASSRWDADVSNSGHSSTRRRRRSDSFSTNPPPLRHESFSERRERVLGGAATEREEGPRDGTSSPTAGAVPSPTLRLPQRKPSTTSLDDDSEE